MLLICWQPLDSWGPTLLNIILYLSWWTFLQITKCLWHILDLAFPCYLISSIWLLFGARFLKFYDVSSHLLIGFRPSCCITKIRLSKGNPWWTLCFPQSFDWLQSSRCITKIRLSKGNPWCTYYLICSINGKNILHCSGLSWRFKIQQLVWLIWYTLDTLVILHQHFI